MATSGALTGAGTGAAIGTAVNPGLGTAIGAGAGLLIGALGDSNSQNAKHEAIESALGEMSSIPGLVNDTAASNAALAQMGLTNASSMWDANGDLVQNYNNALDALNNTQGYEASIFDYDKSIQDFYDPAFQLSVNMANDAINNSQAASGNMFSSDTLNKLAAKNNVMATDMYKEARDALAQDKTLEQSIWQGNETAKQAEANSAANLATSRLNAYGTGMSNLASAQQDYINNLMGINSDVASDLSDYYGTRASIKANDEGEKSWYETVLDPLGIFG